MLLITYVITTIMIVVVIMLAWRFASKRHTLPCPSWLSVLVEMDNPFTTINRAKNIIDSLGVAPGMRVLDVGCGPGRLTIPLAKAVQPNGCVVALDIQQAMLDKVQKKVDDLNLTNIEYINAGIGQGKLPTNLFDRVVLVTVIGEIVNPLHALQEIHAAMADQGILSVTELIFDPHFQRQKTILALAQQTGFKCKSIYGNAIAYTMHLEKV